MQKKIIIFSILAILMLVSISFATAVNTYSKSDKKESPLFNFRTKKAINQNIKNIITRFFGKRVFFLTFKWEKILNKNVDSYTEEDRCTNDVVCRTQAKDTYCPTDCHATCLEGCTSQPTIICGTCTEGIICDP